MKKKGSRAKTPRRKERLKVGGQRSDVRGQISERGREKEGLSQSTQGTQRRQVRSRTDRRR